MAVVIAPLLPAPTLPTNRTNATVTYDDHAVNHNNANDAINQTITAVNGHLTDNLSNLHPQYLQLAGGTMLLASQSLTLEGRGATFLLQIKQELSAQPSLFVRYDGRVEWGPGDAASDTRLSRGGAGRLDLFGSFVPTVTNTYDLGITGLRWRKLWGVDAEFTNAPTVNGVSMDTRYRLSSVATVDIALRTYIQQIMAVLDPGGAPPPAP
jgi:hypothetical protein